MNRFRALTLAGTLAMAITCAAAAAAQTAPDLDERLGNQADRISSGIRDGSLTAGEAARLEGQQARILREEQRVRSDGNLSLAERRRLRQDVNRASSQIWGERHDAQGNMAPTPYVDGRRENLQRRIDAGAADGSLTGREVARLRRQEDHIARAEARFKSDGSFTPAERQHIVRDENRVSRHIYRQRHDAQKQPGTK
jgi:hypothetical protein